MQICMEGDHDFSLIRLHIHPDDEQKYLIVHWISPDNFVIVDYHEMKEWEDDVDISIYQFY